MGRDRAEFLPFSRSELFSSPRPRLFKSESASSLAFPIGGIETGTISIGARGELTDWEIFNRPAKGKNLPYSFFAIHIKEDRQKPVARILEAQLTPPYSATHGLSPLFLPGLPRLCSAHLEGTYPFARIRFNDDELPVRISLEAFNPFIPMNAKDSGIPAAIFTFTVKNISKRPVEGTLVASMVNAVGYAGKVHPWLWAPYFGRNVNEWVQSERLCGIKMTKKDIPADSPIFGSMALATSLKSITWCLKWSEYMPWARKRGSSFAPGRRAADLHTPSHTAMRSGQVPNTRSRRY